MAADCAKGRNLRFRGRGVAIPAIIALVLALIAGGEGHEEKQVSLFGMQASSRPEGLCELPIDAGPGRRVVVALLPCQGGSSGVDAALAGPEPVALPGGDPSRPADPGDGWTAPGRDEVRAWVRATWPEAPEVALRVVGCESDDGQHPDTYDLGAENAGPMQLNRATWEAHFQAKYGWTWADVAGLGGGGLATHFAAGREVFERGGGWFPWSCWP